MRKVFVKEEDQKFDSSAAEARECGRDQIVILSTLENHRGQNLTTITIRPTRVGAITSIPLTLPAV
jgi:hypothetical protein